MSVTQRVQEILDQSNGRGPVELAWEHVSEPYVVRELYAVLRRREPKLAIDAARVKFLEEEQYRRDGKVFRREMYECVEALGGTGARWVPYFIAHLDLAPFALALGHIGDPRAIPPLVARLESGSGTVLAAVIDALGRLRATSAVDRLIAFAHMPLPQSERDRIGHRRIVANACLALGRIGDERAMPALLDLVTDTPPEMDSVVARAIVGLGWLGDDRGTHALLPHLEGRHRNVSMYALARIADRSSASHVEAVAARLSGTPEQLVYPRLMLEALRSRLGRVVDLDVVRHSLAVIMASRFEAAELHETALRMLAVHGEKDDVVATARRFVDAEHPRVREAARYALASAGWVIEPNWLDRARVEELYRREGVRGFVSALANPDSVFRHNVLRKAAEVEAGAEIEGPALAAARAMVGFPAYSDESVLDRHESTFDALESLARFHSPAADAFLVSLLDHPNVMIRGLAVEIAKVDVYGASERVREALRERLRTKGAARPTLPVARLGGGPWIFGPPVRALTVDRAGTRFAALGDKKLVLFDADGTVVRSLDIGDGVALAFERNGERLVVTNARGAVIVVDARSGEPTAEIATTSAQRVRAIAVAADGRVIVGTMSGRLVKASSENVSWSRKLEAPIDALVTHPDAPQVLVAVGKRALWLDERDGSERAATKSGARIVDVSHHAPTHTVAVLRSTNLELCDEATLEVRARVPVRGGARVAFAREGRALVVATTGKEHGLVRVDVGASVEAFPIARLAHTPLAMAVDPSTSLALVAGDGVRVEQWDLSGASNSPPVAQHTSAVDAVLADGARNRAFSFGADGLVLQWDTETREIVAGWRIPRGGRVVGATLGATGRTLVVAFTDRVGVLDLVTGALRWEREVARTVGVARVPGAVWLLAGAGVLRLDEQNASNLIDDGARGRTKGKSRALHVLRANPKRGRLVALDDFRFAIVAPNAVVAIDVRTHEVVDRVATGKSPTILAAAALESGLLTIAKDRTLSRWLGTPLERVAHTKLERMPTSIAVDEQSERVAVALEEELLVLESDLRERARVRLEHGISALGFAERGLLVCGGSGGEISLVETER